MQARVISLISGVVIMLTVLGLQLITACNSIEGNFEAADTNTIGMSEILKNDMLGKITLASVVIIIISLGVLIIDKYLDR
jgi:hypothetical protein